MAAARLVESTPAVWWMPLALIVATEYKLRKRANTQTVSGSADKFIVIELAVYAMVGLYVLLKLRSNLRPVPILVWTVGWCLTAAVSTLYAPVAGAGDRACGAARDHRAGRVATGRGRRPVVDAAVRPRLRRPHDDLGVHRSRLHGTAER